MASFDIDISTLEMAISSLAPKTTKALEKYGDTVGAKMEAVAKQNAPWQDRTGDARRFINHDSYFVNDTLVVSVFNNQVPYMPYLEYARKQNGEKYGKYAILNPTRDEIKDEALKGLENLLDRLR